MAGIDEVMERLVADAGFRARFAADPGAALAGYDLTRADLELLANQLDVGDDAERAVEQRTSKSAMLSLLATLGDLPGGDAGGGMPIAGDWDGDGDAAAAGVRVAAGDVDGGPTGDADDTGVQTEILSMDLRGDHPVPAEVGDVAAPDEGSAGAEGYFLKIGSAVGESQPSGGEPVGAVDDLPGAEGEPGEPQAARAKDYFLKVEGIADDPQPAGADVPMEDLALNFEEIEAGGDDVGGDLAAPPDDGEGFNKASPKLMQTMATAPAEPEDESLHVYGYSGATADVPPPAAGTPDVGGEAGPTVDGGSEPQAGDEHEITYDIAAGTVSDEPADELAVAEPVPGGGEGGGPHVRVFDGAEPAAADDGGTPRAEEDVFEIGDA